jgi:hypothetical protein
MRLRTAFFAVTMAVVPACRFAMLAQQSPAAAGQTERETSPADMAEVASAAASIAHRAEHLKPMFEEVHATDWVAKGAPEAYVAQWNSLTEQNDAIQAEMTGVGESVAAEQTGGAPPALEVLLHALFRVHRFDGDLGDLLKAVGHYQNPALADLIGSVATGDQPGVEKLQLYALELAGEKDRQLSVVDKEAQRCRSQLASQPVSRPCAPVRTPSGKTSTAAPK